MAWFVIGGLSLGLIGYSIYAVVRIRKGQVLRFIAGLMQRDLPLEASLRECVSAFPSGEEIALKFVENRLARGESLPEALALGGLISGPQRSALELAIERGGAPALMRDFADDRIRVDKGWMRHYIVAYPILVGAVVAAVLAFILWFIFPKFEAMFREMEIGRGVTLEFAFYASLFPLVLFGNIVLIASLMIRTIAGIVWFRVPFLGRHVRYRSQAELCNLLSTLLGAGIPLEQILEGQSLRSSGQPYWHELERVLMDIRNGALPAEAFERHGPRGAEFQWAIRSLSQGVQPKQAFSHVADLLYRRAYLFEDRLYRCCAALTLILSSVGIGTLAYVIFDAMVTIQKTMF